jgi:hypothetical protein
MGPTSSHPFSGLLQQPPQQPSQQQRQQLSQPPPVPVSATSSSQQPLWGRHGHNRLDSVSTGFNSAYTSVHPESSTVYPIHGDATHRQGVDSHYLQLENRQLRNEIQRLHDQIGRSRLAAAGQCCCSQAPSIDLLMEHLTRMNDIHWDSVQKELKAIQCSLSLLRTNLRDDFSWLVEETNQRDSNHSYQATTDVK